MSSRSRAWLLALVFPLWGQELRVSPLVLSRGKTGSVSIKLSSPAGREPAALQWDLVFPVAQVHVQDGNWSPGSAAHAAGKRLMCVKRLSTKPDTYAYKCMLAGGEKTIRDGVVAVVKIDIPETALSGPAVLRLENVLGASFGAVRLEMKPAQGTVTIR